MTDKAIKAERAPWGNFPAVVRCGDLGMLKASPHYEAAKAGSVEEALALVQTYLNADFVASVSALAGDRQPRLVPVLALEKAGFNKIPLAMAACLSDATGLEVETGIVQVLKANRTGSGADHRLAFNPVFDGEVTPGQPYLIMDDTLSMGGTLASLRAYIENRGGQVVGACVMTAHEGALSLPVKQAMLDRIENKHGNAMNTFWQETFGYGIEQLTQGEAGHLRAAASVDALRDRLTAARYAASTGPDAAASETKTGEGVSHSLRQQFENGLAHLQASASASVAPKLK